MKTLDYDRFINPFDALPGLDEMPDFIADTQYLQLKNATSLAFQALKLKRKHRYSMEELKAVLDQFADLFKQADAVLKYYSANDSFVYHYVDLCEHYATLERHLSSVASLVEIGNNWDHHSSVKDLFKWKEEFSAIYENTYFVAEFSSFRHIYENIRDAAWFLEYDTIAAKKALQKYAAIDTAEDQTDLIFWVYEYYELYERIRDRFMLDSIFGDPISDYLPIYQFLIPKSEVRTMLDFFERMSDYQYQRLKSHLRNDR